MTILVDHKTDDTPHKINIIYLFVANSYPFVKMDKKLLLNCNAMHSKGRLGTILRGELMTKVGAYKCNLLIMYQHHIAVKNRSRKITHSLIAKVKITKETI